MRLLDRILGRRLATSEEEEHRVGVWEGIPMLGLDALGSSAYGPEAALTVLLPLGAAASAYEPKILLLITALLLVVFVSYRQTIAAYPNGGGSYIVASDNLGPFAGVVAAAALMLDYVLNVAVGISAGVGALISALPSLHQHTLVLCLVILVLITIVNLRGVRESGMAMALPTYLFIAAMGVVLVLGCYNLLHSGGHPKPQVPLPTSPATVTQASFWLLVRAFASGCTAMTGVEAVSNAVQAFREPTVKNARRTLTALVVILTVLLLGIAALTHAYGIVATKPDARGYQSVLSQVVSAITGRGWFYYLTIGSSIMVLCLSANTSFADFPRLCRLLAQDKYLPHAFSTQGRRLVFSIGIAVLATISGALLVIFGGVTDRLIPLFAVGALLAFTMSQFGMVRHAGTHPQSGNQRKRAVNLFGAICTATALLVVLAAKFADGAWITIVLIFATILLFLSVKRHYHFIEQVIHTDDPLDLQELNAPIVVVPMTGWTKVTAKAMRFALTISSDVKALHVSLSEEEEQKVCEDWIRHVETPLEAIGRASPTLETIRSPYRRFYGPLLSFLVRTQEENPNRTIAVVIPELVEVLWYQLFLHSQRGVALKAALLFKGGSRVVVMSVPWYPTPPSSDVTTSV